jgi:hypothetical protein
MKNVTISMDEDLAAWARVEAAKADMSLSRWLAQRLRMLRDSGPEGPNIQQIALANLLSGPMWPLTADGPLPSREELYAERLRGHQRDPLSEGRIGSREEPGLRGVAEPPQRFEDGDNQSSGDQ